MPPIAFLLAHQGGWDEALFVAVPMAILVALLWLAQRRAAAEQDAEARAGERPDLDER